MELKGLSYQSQTVNLLKKEHQAPDYLSKNPSGFVPCLMIDGEPYSESLAIIEWLDETYPTPALLPQDSKGRLTVRRLAQIIAVGVQPIQNLAVQQYVSSEPTERQAFARHWIERGFKTYESLVEKTAGSFSFGSEVTLADLCLIPQVYNANRFSVDMTPFPKIDRIYNTAMETSACQKAQPENQPDAN